MSGGGSGGGGFRRGSGLRGAISTLVGVADGNLVASHQVFQPLVVFLLTELSGAQGHLLEVLEANFALADVLLGPIDLSLLVAGHASNDDLNDKEYCHQSAQAGHNEEFISIHGKYLTMG